ncbi:MAG: MBL fold metallo-hydrolase [Candidatus Aminicenantes bacterium]|nr:MBL fold metallo-hydrolase [Deltaproteobacteria bacterium]MCD6516343.1 MBL fold metallo-hydrolase [Candidatus Aminicenantes bacterium]
MKTTAIKMVSVLVIGCFLVSSIPAQNRPGQKDSESKTKVILLGTGTPNPDPHHSGCSVAITVNETPYIIDFGPGLVRKAAALSPSYGGPIPALEPKRLKTAFLTHLHSDHTTGYPDLILTPWVMGRDEPLEVYGPEGIKEMTQNILKAYKEDIKYRLYGTEPANDKGWRVHTHEIKPGMIYSDAQMKVEAFEVNHGTWPHAFGFRFITPDKIIVISGDTAPCDNIIEFAKSADILIHEVYSQKGFEKRSPVWQKYHTQHHTSTHELSLIAQKTRPKLLILYHILLWGTSEQELLQEITDKYDGKVVIGSDLDIYE